MLRCGPCCCRDRLYRAREQKVDPRHRIVMRDARFCTARESRSRSQERPERRALSMGRHCNRQHREREQACLAAHTLLIGTDERRHDGTHNRQRDRTDKRQSVAPTSVSPVAPTSVSPLHRQSSVPLHRQSIVRSHLIRFPACPCCRRSCPGARRVCRAATASGSTSACAPGTRDDDRL